MSTTYSYSDNDILFIDPNWALKNDHVCIILYTLEDQKTQYFKLPYDVGILVQLIDGTTTLKQIVAEIKSIFSIRNSSIARSYVDKIISYLNNKEEIIKKSSVGIEIPIYQKGDFFIPFENYDISKRRTNFPLTITAVFTNRCTTDCIYCYADRTEFKSEMSVSDWKSLFDEVKSNGGWKIEITGGDLFARSDSIELIEYLIENDFIFFISTKSPVSQEYAFRISSCGFSNPVGIIRRNFQLSIDSHDPYVANFLTRKNGFYDSIITSIQNLTRYNIIPQIKCVLTPFNYNHIENIILDFSKLGITEFHFVQYGRSMYRHQEKLFLTKSQKLYIHKSYQKVKTKYSHLNITVQDDIGEYDYTNVRLSVEDWKNRSRCSGGFCSLIILPNGDTLLCDQLPQNSDFSMGNVRSESISSLWNGVAINDFLFSSREKFFHSVCYDCKEFEECHYITGYCYRESLFHYGSLYDAPPGCPYQTKPAIRML